MESMNLQHFRVLLADPQSEIKTHEETKVPLNSHWGLTRSCIVEFDLTLPRNIRHMYIRLRNKVQLGKIFPSWGLSQSYPVVETQQIR